MTSLHLSALTRKSNRTLLSVLSTPSPGNRPALPHELILQILYHPSRWILQFHHILPRPVTVSERIGSKVLLRTPPLTARSLALFRQVLFSFQSHDQGWSSFPNDQGTFINSWTWFDVAIENNHYAAAQGDTVRGTESRRQLLQFNRHGVAQPNLYSHVLDRSNDLLKDLRIGDEILLIACAKFPGWENFVQNADVEIFGVDDLSDEPWALGIQEPETQEELGNEEVAGQELLEMEMQEYWEDDDWETDDSGSAELEFDDSAGSDD